MRLRTEEIRPVPCENSIRTGDSPPEVESSHDQGRCSRSFTRLECNQRYYNEVRTHLSLTKDAPIPRDIHGVGQVVSFPILGGLHHHYVRV